MVTNMKKFTLKIAALALSVAMLFSLSGCTLDLGGMFNSSTYQSVQTGEGILEIRFLYVGQADCSLVTMPDGTTMLVDGGNDSDGGRIADYLEAIGVESLDFVVSTHPHEDHLGGLDKILERFEAGAVYVPEMPDSALPDTVNYKDFVKAAEKQECGLTEISAGEQLYSGDGITVDCLSPDSRDVYSDLNNYSIVLRVRHGQNSFLLMGDAEYEVEELLRRSGDISADVIKVGHHGSKTSSGKKFIKAVSPSYAVISCGIDNKYGFPNDKTIETLESVGAEIFVMSECGSVFFESDGSEITRTIQPNLLLDGK